MEEKKLLRRKKKALKDGNQVLLATACISLAEFHQRNGNFISAIEEFEIVATAYKTDNRAMDYGRANRMIGEMYLQLKDYDKALEYQKNHLDIAKEQNDKLEVQRAHATFGHIYLTRFLDNNDNPDNNFLNLANRAFMKSLTLCESLVTISKLERVDMSARLFANLGIVQDCLGNYDQGIELLEKSITLCRDNDLFEQLERSYTLLGALYVRKRDYSKALYEYNLAIETAKRLENKVSLICASLVAKADILVKLADYNGAKNLLLKAHKLKNPSVLERESIERNLKVVASMCYTEDSLLTTSVTDYKKRKKLYEKMGDGVSELKNFSKAIEYYQKMLECAIKNNDTEKELLPCYISLAQTYRDDKQYDLAIKYFQKEYNISRDDLKESLKTLYTIADTMDQAHKSVEDIEAIYEKAKKKCVIANNVHLIAKTLKQHINFLKDRNNEIKVKELEKELLKMGCDISDNESEESPIEDTLNIGDDICIDNITDVSNESDTEKDFEKPRTARKRHKRLTVKKNTKGETQLHIACISGNVELARRLLDQGHSVHIRDNAGWLPLHEACLHGHLEIVKMLLDKGASINDRGETHCDGISPLHDAAANGHLEIIQLLLEKGASPLIKNDNGETPLHMLKTWKNSVQLSPVQNDLYDTIVNRMTNALEKSVHLEDVAVNNKENRAHVIENEENLSECRISKNKTKSINESTKASQNKTLPKKQIGSLRRNVECDIDVPSTSNYNYNEGNHLVSSSHVTDEYKRVMENVKRPSFVSYEKKRKSYEMEKGSALVDADHHDDWLVDDMGVNSNKKRKNSVATDLINTSNMRCPTNCPNKETSPRKINRNLSTDSIASKSSKEDFNIVDTFTDSAGNLREIPRDDETSWESNLTSNKRNCQTPLIYAGFNRYDASSSKKIQKSTSNFGNKRTLQTKLTNYPQVAIEKVNLVNKDDFIDSNKTKTSNNNTSLQHIPDNPMLSVDVRIEGRLYRVPVSLTDSRVKTIRWLSKEAGKRYFRKTCVKPTLELESKNGAILGDDDLVSILFPHGSLQAEEVQAKILKLDLPQLSDRYKEICASCDEVPDLKLLQALQETSTILDLSDLNLRSKKLSPICKAINRQNNLHHLNLSGNFMTKDCVLLLSSSLTSLNSLSLLNLSLNHLDSESLKCISDMFINSSSPILENLTSLDLSYNPLGDNCIKYLAIISRYLKLQTLCLSSVDFTKDIFEHFYNKTIVLYLDHLEKLNISNNELNVQGILKFISWLTPSKLVHLDVSNNAVYEQGLLKTVIECFSNNNEYSLNLKSLNFSRCCVTDAEIFDLLRILSTTSNILDCLSLSYNDNLTALTLRRLIQHYPPLQRLELHGCENILKWFDKCSMDTWAFSDTKDLKKLKYLSLSIDYTKNKNECNVLIDIWKKEYLNECTILNLPNFILFTVP